MTARRKSPANDATPVPAAGSGPRFIAIASGKGGVGKSFFSAGLAWGLAQTGKRVVAVDADFGGPNLHTCLGVKASESPGLAALEAGRPLEDVLVGTGLPSLHLVSGVAEPLHAPNLKATAWQGALSRLRDSDADFVLLDLGGGSTYTTVDLFLAAHQGIVLTTPEPTAMENAYRFLKTLFFRFTASHASNERIRKLVTESLYAEGSMGRIRSPVALLQEITNRNAAYGREMEEALAALSIAILVNQTRVEADVALPQAMATATRKVFALPCRPLGSIPYDADVNRAVRERKPFLETAADSPAACALRELAQRLGAGEAFEATAQLGSAS